MTTLFAVLVLSSGLTAFAGTNTFRSSPAKPAHESSERVSEDSISPSFLSEIERSLQTPTSANMGTGKASDHVSKIEATLGPMYAALTKNHYGNLEHTSARYALHRFFVARHGWSVTGLEPSAGKHKYNASSPAGVLKDKVPTDIEDKFEQRLNGKGFNLHELAVLAATIEHVIQEDAVTRLGSVFKIHGTSVTGAFSEDDAKEMLDTFIAGFILSENLASKDAPQAKKLRKQMPDIFLLWPETQAFMQGVLSDITPTNKELNFGVLAKFAVVMGDQFGKFWDDEVCSSTKAALVKMGHGGIGSIRLSDFYKPAVDDGNRQFMESAAYLRELGALEESNLDEPRVMIANYMVSSSVCIAGAGFYAVCCKNECEGLLGHLEKKIAAPEATPETLAALVEALPSSSVLAPRILSDTSFQRLNEIAATNGGTVPLHGRLFGQWMHHTYPLECPYPHVSDANQKLPEEKLGVERPRTHSASKEEMKKHMHNAEETRQHRQQVPAEDLMPWSPEEELLVERRVGRADVRPVGRAEASIQTPEWRRNIMRIAAAGALAYACICMLKKMLLAPKKSERFFI